MFADSHHERARARATTTISRMHFLPRRVFRECTRTKNKERDENQARDTWAAKIYCVLCLFLAVCVYALQAQVHFDCGKPPIHLKMRRVPVDASTSFLH